MDFTPKRLSLKNPHLPYFSSALLGTLAVFLFFSAVLFTQPKTLQTPQVYLVGGVTCESNSDCGSHSYCDDILNECLCASGYVDCNDDSSDGCECDLMTQTCIGGACVNNASPSPSPLLSSSPDPSQAIEAAINLLVALKDVSLESISVVTVESVNWRNSCLECPKPDERCLTVIVFGYSIIFKSGENTYTMHTNRTGSSVRLCGESSPSSLPVSSPSPSPLPLPGQMPGITLRLKLDGVPANNNDHCGEDYCNLPQEFRTQKMTVLLEKEADGTDVYSQEIEFQYVGDGLWEGIL